MIKINLRKKVQVVHDKDTYGIMVVYKDKNGKHEEPFTFDEINQLREGDYVLTDTQVLERVYKRFNETLRPDESKRTPIAMFYMYSAKVYEKIKFK